MTYTLDAALFDYRLKKTWVTVATLNADANAVLINFAVVTDQPSVNTYPWGPPADDGTLYPAYTRYGQYSDQTQWADGPINTLWLEAYFTEGMIYWWENTLLFGSDSVQTIAVTLKTRKHNGQPGYYQGYANRAKPNIDYKRGVYGVTLYRQPFVNCVEIFPA